MSAVIQAAPARPAVLRSQSVGRRSAGSGTTQAAWLPPTGRRRGRQIAYTAAATSRRRARRRRRGRRPRAPQPSASRRCGRRPARARPTAAPRSGRWAATDRPGDRVGAVVDDHDGSPGRGRTGVLGRQSGPAAGRRIGRPMVGITTAYRGRRRGGHRPTPVRTRPAPDQVRADHQRVHRRGAEAVPARPVGRRPSAGRRC